MSKRVNNKKGNESVLLVEPEYVHRPYGASYQHDHEPPNGYLHYLRRQLGYDKGKEHRSALSQFHIYNTKLLDPLIHVFQKFHFL